MLLTGVGYAQASRAFELTGTVLDATTRQPIEGAYVIASYKIVRSGPAATGSFCVRALGTYTGPDGVYRFPVEKLDGYSPYSTNAIKPGYYLKDADYPDPNSEAWRRQRPEGYKDRNIYLKKQDPGHPVFKFSDHQEVCEEAKGPALDPALKFIEMEIAEEKRLGAAPNGVRGHEDLLRALQGLPPATAPVDRR
jgi:hypothetical protein